HKMRADALHGDPHLQETIARDFKGEADISQGVLLKVTDKQDAVTGLVYVVGDYSRRGITKRQHLAYGGGAYGDGQGQDDPHRHEHRQDDHKKGQKEGRHAEVERIGQGFGDARPPRANIDDLFAFGNLVRVFHRQAIDA
ncbi:MAG: hypothetical protein P3W87_007505, partial [Gammaproteobacteria bacterium]|nr:hypothetical protein [Gammaproteobacteria bacterium]